MAIQAGALRFPGSVSVVFLGAVIAACASTDSLTEIGDDDGGAADTGRIAADAGLDAVDVATGALDAGVIVDAGMDALDAGAIVDAGMDALDADSEADSSEVGSSETPEASALEAGGDSGATGQCVPMTCAQEGYECGQATDGCGKIIQCGTCVLPQYCGGGGFSKCGGTGPIWPDGDVILCTPWTCQSLGYECGLGGDGCGGVVSCGTCVSPGVCGGGGPNRCGGDSGASPDGG